MIFQSLYLIPVLWNNIRTPFPVRGRDQAKEVRAGEGLELGQDKGALVGKDLEKAQGSGKEVPVEHGLETARGREEAVLVGEDQELGDLVCLTPDTLKIQNLSILWRPERKDTRGKSY
jgi:hypothetical protein